MQVVDDAVASAELGLIGDRYRGRSGDRQVTLMQAEHLPVIASCAGHGGVTVRVLTGGPIFIGDAVSLKSMSPEANPKIQKP